MKQVCFAICLLSAVNTRSQLVLTGNAPLQLLDFSSSMPSSVGSTPASSFSAAGFEPNPVQVGRLNSNSLAISGWSDGALVFGGSRITPSTDYTRGSTNSAVITGGIYAYSGLPASVSDPIMLFQPGGGDFAPGSMILKVVNGGTAVIRSMTIQYDLFVRNDQGRSSSFNFSHGSDGSQFTAVPSLDYISPAAADLAGLVHIGAGPSRSLLITGLTLLPGSFYYLRWSSDDVSGSGSRDEFGIDNILVSADYAESPLPVSLLDLRAEIANENNQLSWRTVFEQNNRGFEVQRSADGVSYQAFDFIQTRAFNGNSQEQLWYSCIDKNVGGHSWYYRLRQIDEDGRYGYSLVISCDRQRILMKGPFPNPVKDQYYLEVYSAIKTSCRVMITNMAGQVVLNHPFNVIRGLNRWVMQARNWSSGAYQLSVYGEDGINLGRQLFLKQ